MPNLEELEQAYRNAREAYEADKTEENHDNYRQAKLEFTEARVTQRQAEESDPDHSRGKGLVQVDNEA